MKSVISSISKSFKYYYMVDDKKVYCTNVKVEVEEVNILTNEKTTVVKTRLSKQTYEELEPLVNTLCEVKYEKVNDFTFYTFTAVEEVNVDLVKPNKSNEALEKLGINIK